MVAIAPGGLRRAQNMRYKILLATLCVMILCITLQVFRHVKRTPDRPAKDVGRLERPGRGRRPIRGTAGGREPVLGAVAGRGVGRLGPVGVRAAAAERRPVPPAGRARRVHQLGRQPVPPGPRRAAHRGHTKGTGQIPFAARRLVPVTHHDVVIHTHTHTYAQQCYSAPIHYYY